MTIIKDTVGMKCYLKNPKMDDSLWVPLLSQGCSLKIELSHLIPVHLARKL